MGNALTCPQCEKHYTHCACSAANNLAERQTPSAGSACSTADFLSVEAIERKSVTGEPFNTKDVFFLLEEVKRLQEENYTLNAKFKAASGEALSVGEHFRL